MKKLLSILIAVIAVFPTIVNALEFQSVFDEYFPGGRIKVKGINPGPISTRETLVYHTIEEILKENPPVGVNFSYFSFDIEKCPDGTCGYIEIFDDETIEEYLVYLDYFVPDTKTSEKVNKYVDTYRELSEGEEEYFFTISDLEIINYMLNGGFNDEYHTDVINSIINYSTELKKLLANTNIYVRLETRAGWGGGPDIFSSGGFGDLMFYYNDHMYGTVDRGGVKGYRILYVPSTTEDTTEAYIAAALKRIEDYIGKDKVTLKYGGKLADLDEKDAQYPSSVIADLDNTLGEYYILNILGKDHYFLIEKNDEKLQTNHIFTTTDLETDVSIETDKSEVPLDSYIKSKKHDKDSDTYKKIMKELKKEHGIVYDIDLYSHSNSKYITKLANGKFKVRIPIDKEFEGKKVVAYYIHSNGKVDNHVVTVKDGYGEFETDHFSTYTIAEVDGETPEITVPSTGDNIIISMVLSIIAIMGIGLSSIYLKKQ